MLAVCLTDNMGFSVFVCLFICILLLAYVWVIDMVIGDVVDCTYTSFITQVGRRVKDFIYVCIYIRLIFKQNLKSVI